MKHVLRFSGLLLLFVSVSCVGQDTSSTLTSNWKNLKAQLQTRTKIVSNLTNVLSKSSEVNKTSLNNAKNFNSDLFNIVDTLNLANSISISLASEQNSKLTQALSRTLATLENDPSFRGREDVVSLMAQLEGCENRIALAKNEYNSFCKHNGRLDLLFDKGQSKDTREVKF